MSRTANGKIHIQDVPRSEWIVLVPNAHAGYISWQDYERNEAQLALNSQAYAPQRFSPPREGPALLQGLIICGICGERMTVRYHQRGGKRIIPDYLCQSQSIAQGRTPCQRIPGRDLDRAIEAVLLERVTPEAGLSNSNKRNTDQSGQDQELDQCWRQSNASDEQHCERQRGP